jgi:sarcosine oxidase subunit beta
METADVAVIGAGVVGFSVAYELAKAGAKKIVLLEREALSGMGSTAACTGGIRLQFSSEAHIRFSRYGLEAYVSLAEQWGVDIGLRRNGYLFLITREDEINLYTRGHDLQRALGVDVGFVDTEWIGRTAPFLSLDGVLTGSYCRLEAHADPHAVVEAYRRGLGSFGIRAQTEREVTGIDLSGTRITGVRTHKGPISTTQVVDCAGPFAGEVALMAGVALPVVSRKRHVLVVRPVEHWEQTLPLIVDGGTGWYMKAEPGGIALIGGTDREGKVSLQTSPEQDAIERIIESGIRRVPRLEEAGMVRTIVGLRCLSPDDHALLGKVPGVEGFYCAVAFSGHGFMHAAAAGAAIAELMLNGKAASFDLGPFEPGRFSAESKGEPEKYVF